MTSSGPEQMPSGPERPPPDPPAGPGRERLDLGRLRPPDLGVAAGTLLFLVFLALPWYSSIDIGGVEFPLQESASGFELSGTLTSAFVVLLLATLWALLPAAIEVAVSFPRAFITVGLAVLAFLLTVIEWLRSLDLGFSGMGFLSLLAAAGVLACAVLRLLPDLRGSSSAPAAWGPPPAGQVPPAAPPAPWGRPPAAPPASPGGWTTAGPDAPAPGPEPWT